MDEIDYLSQYNGDPIHDMWVDFDENENLGQRPDIAVDDNIDMFIDKLNDWD